MKLMSYGDYARHRGCNLKTVQDAISAGRITVSTDTKGVRWIDQEAADIAWALNSDPGFDRNKRPSGGKPPPPTDPSQVITVAPDANSPIQKLQKARGEKESFNAKLAEIEYKRQIGSIIDLDQVKKVNFELVRRIRNAILGVPARIAAEVAAEVDPHKVEVMMTKEINEALAELSKLATPDKTKKS